MAPSITRIKNWIRADLTTHYPRRHGWKWEIRDWPNQQDPQNSDWEGRMCSFDLFFRGKPAHIVPGHRIEVNVYDDNVPLHRLCGPRCGLCDTLDYVVPNTL